MLQDSERRGRPRSRSVSPRRPDDTRRRNDHARQEKRSRSASRRPSADGRREGGRRRSKSKSKSRSRSASRSRRKDAHRRRSRSRSREGGRSHSRERRKDRDHPERRERRKRSISSTSSRSDDAGEKKRSKKKRRGSRERRKEKKREKKERKERKKASVSTPQWGKYGIIAEVDIYTKASEFHTWLVEERKINPETISKEQSKKEFVRFVEDFNTATLPHEKYYNMEAHERRMSALRQGEFLPPPEDTYDPRADMKAIIGAHKRKAVEQDSYLNKEQLMELRQVLHDRTAAAKMKLIGMEVGQNMGVRMDGTMFDE